jgi:DNA-binding response OmpR family regulator
MRKLLIVDGTASLTSSYTETFRRDGFEVLNAASSEEARELIRRSAPDVVIMDVRTAGEAGTELAEEINSRFPDVPLIFHTSADEEMSDRELWLADAVVSKSSNLNELRQTVEEVIRSRAFEKYGEPPPREMPNRRFPESER